MTATSNGGDGTGTVRCALLCRSGSRTSHASRVGRPGSRRSDRQSRDVGADPRAPAQPDGHGPGSCSPEAAVDGPRAGPPVRVDALDDDGQPRGRTRRSKCRGRARERRPTRSRPRASATGVPTCSGSAPVASRRGRGRPGRAYRASVATELREELRGRRRPRRDERHVGAAAPRIDPTGRRVECGAVAAAAVSSRCHATAWPATTTKRPPRAGPCERRRRPAGRRRRARRPPRR